MVLRLDPRLPLVWRTPDTLQIGINTSALVLKDVTSAQERMVAALAVGVSRPGLQMIGHTAGAGGEDIDDLVARLNPALEASTPAQRAVVAVTGDGSTADLIRTNLRHAGVTVSPDSEKTTLAVIVAQFVVEPEMHGRWLRRDVVHLPIVFRDVVVNVGPLIEPGVGPCLYCLERFRTDADAAWPAIASQLWGRVSRIDGGVVASEVAALATRMILALINDPDAHLPTGTSLELDALTGLTAQSVWGQHPECQCGALDDAANVPSHLGEPAFRPAQPENGMLAAPPGPRRR